jgi:hypothetical protein
MITARTLVLGAAILCWSAIVGCSSNNPNAAGSVSGRLSYNGTPIKGGSMVFHTKDGGSYPASIKDDGTYFANDIPEGEFVVTIDTEGINPAKKAGKSGKDYEKRMAVGQQPPPSGMAAPDLSQYYIKIPEKYNNPRTSTVTITVKAGRNVHDIDLKD